MCDGTDGFSLVKFKAIPLTDSTNQSFKMIICCDDKSVIIVANLAHCTLCILIFLLVQRAILNGFDWGGLKQEKNIEG